ncbi:MAG: hypothetical protein KHX49_12325 [Lachnospiraceae bacterium]|uniref:Uncharacterized protein n=1 Tax=Candidatus Enterocloster excrementigallinarum TaxID=2838558 RepID=A0A9D2PXE9_9FIRM|nr:hypothetical protein [Lachnospiraceae bacterium]HJC66990.1 hypothetical protein [Candidatus Enterocloster excrementigallinarum]
MNAEKTQNSLANKIAGFPCFLPKNIVEMTGKMSKLQGLKFDCEKNNEIV